MNRFLALLITFFCLFSLLLSIYGFCQLWTRAERLKKMQNQQAQISLLKDRIYWLRQANDIVPVIEQILTPMQIKEIKLLAEQMKQRKKTKKEINNG